MTVPVEKRFRAISLHSKSHQVISALLKTMQVDWALKLILMIRDLEKVA
jgi:hypothetical protein